MNHADDDCQSKLPDFRFINAHISIKDVALKLDLRLGSNGNFHCWRTGQHQHGDRTASVGIRKVPNKLKCFVCDQRNLGPIDLVMSVLDLGKPKEAALWIAERFSVRTITKRRQKDWRDSADNVPYGFEGDLGILIRSGLWAKLAPAARSIAPIMVEFKRDHGENHRNRIKISYRALMRYSGMTSPNSISKALNELIEIGWLERKHASGGLIRPTGDYEITSHSDALCEIVHSEVAEFRETIAREREAREMIRKTRMRARGVNPSAE